MSAKEPLLQYILASRQRVWGTRVFDDGKVGQYSSAGVSGAQGGEILKHLSAAHWSPRAELTADEIKDLHQAIDDAKFFELPASLGAAGAVQDGSTMVWTVADGKKKHEVTAYGPDQQRNPALEQLRMAFESMVTEALNRDDPDDPEAEDEG